MSQKTVLIWSFYILLVSSPTSSFAWGAKGHKMVVELAFSLLSPSVQQRVLFYLNGYPIENAATWMDSVRGKHVRDFKYMKSWHFMDMEGGETYEQVGNDDDIVYNLQRVTNTLSQVKTLSRDSVDMNLRILFHLIGDITQPLHCGYGSDKGGNEIWVATPKYNSKKNNLHHVWDDVIIDNGRINTNSLIAYYKTLSVSQIKKAQKGAAKDWMLLSRAYLPNVYAFNLMRGGVSQLSMEYLNINVPLVKQQLAFAAIRLAYALERGFH